ncbi:uncharacterized protein [Drosophila tropicalis]|uniref:uncharacterized protein isoform X1 n=1 Tax=Drosophila tropicalis TaxID=46794 RepID=UPI0035AC1BB2
MTALASTMLGNTPQRIRRLGDSLQMLTKEARREVVRCEHIVICLLILVAVFSIIWSFSLRMLSNDFYDGIISPKLQFRRREEHSNQEVFHRDFARIRESFRYGNRNTIENDVITESLTTESQTSMPIVSHIYALKEDRSIPEQRIAEENNTTTATTKSPQPTLKPNPEADLQFLEQMSIDIHTTIWSRGLSAQFVYAFPILSEILAVIWTAMCLIFRTGSKKNSVLPQPWRIVVPSIIIYTLMSLASVAYTIVTNGHLKRLCGQLRQKITTPISCGDAIALLRPYIREHYVSHDVYLDLFRASYIIVMVLWLMALIITVLRFIFAVDFQLVDIDEMFDQHRAEVPPQMVSVQPVYTEIVQNSPQHQQIETGQRPRSEDDYQSAKSRLSDLAMPLLEQRTSLA